MLVAQELYYFSRGTYRHRKSLTVFYRIQPNGANDIVAVLYPEEMHTARPQGVVSFLPPLEVTPSRFKDFEKKRKG